MYQGKGCLYLMLKSYGLDTQITWSSIYLYHYIITNTTWECCSVLNTIQTVHCLVNKNDTFNMLFLRDDGVTRFTKFPAGLTQIPPFSPQYCCKQWRGMVQIATDIAVN